MSFKAPSFKATVLTLFPEMFPGRWACRLQAARWNRASGRWMPATSGPPHATATARWTIIRQAAGPAWC